VRKPEPAISRVLSSTTIHLGQLSPAASSNLPGSPFGTDGGQHPNTPYWGRCALPVLPYLVLLRAGFTVPRAVASRAVRSYRTFSPLPTEAGGLFSVALSMGSRPPGVTWRPVRRSPDFPLRRTAAIVSPTPALSQSILLLIGVEPRFSSELPRLEYYGCKQLSSCAFPASVCRRRCV